MEISRLLKNKIVKNTSWLMVSKIIHMVLSFLISLLTTRYLGPRNYGLINYAAAYTTFFMSICTLGINSVIVKDFIDKPEEEGVSLGTTFVLRTISTFLSVGLIVLIVRIIDHGETLTILIVFLYSISLFFQVFDTFRQWFQAKLLSKYFAISTLISYVIASFYKIYLLASGKSVVWFAVANSIDYIIIAVFLYIFYKRSNGPRLGFSLNKAKELLSMSSSYILSGMMTAIYASTDRVMLKQLLDESAVGYYSLAVSLSGIWTFILSAIIESVFPLIMQYHNTDKEMYKITNKRLYAAVFYLSVLASVCICIVGEIFVKIMYGAQYIPAVKPLRIVVWYVAFSYLGVARDAWVVCEKKQKYLKYLYFGSAICNVILNIILIPVMGVNGAALASLVTQISTIFVFPLFIKEFHPNMRMIVDAIILKGILPGRS